MYDFVIPVLKELSKVFGRLSQTLEGPLDTKQMSGQVSRGSAGEYQADERAGVTRLSWRVSG